METNKKSLVLGIGAVLAAFGASLCCILPVAVALLGVGSAALGAKLEFLRPWLAILTVIILALAHYRANRPVDCAPGEACALPSTHRRHRRLLWIITLFALLLMAFPYYVAWLF